MSVVFLIFIGMVIYWTMTEHHRNARAAAAARTAATVAPRPAPVAPKPTVAPTTTTATPAPVAAQAAPTPQPTTPQPMIVPEPRPAHAAGGLGGFWAEFLTDHDREALLATATVHSFRAGDVIVHEGDEAAAFCLLIAGRVGLLTNVGDGRHLLAGTLGPGRLFAWMGMVGEHTYTATVHAVLDCEVAIFPAEAVRALCETDPALGYHLMDELAADIAAQVEERDMRLGCLVSR